MDGDGVRADGAPQGSDRCSRSFCWRRRELARTRLRQRFASWRTTDGEAARCACNRAAHTNSGTSSSAYLVTRPRRMSHTLSQGRYRTTSVEISHGWALRTGSNRLQFRNDAYVQRVSSSVRDVVPQPGDSHSRWKRAPAPHGDIPLVPPLEADPLELPRFDSHTSASTRAFDACVLKTKEEADGWDAECVCVWVPLHGDDRSRDAGNASSRCRTSGDRCDHGGVSTVSGSRRDRERWHSAREFLSLADLSGRLSDPLALNRHGEAESRHRRRDPVCVRLAAHDSARRGHHL